MQRAEWRAIFKKRRFVVSQKTTQTIASAGLLFGALCWGVVWYPYRLMQEAGVSGVASSFYTYSLTVFLAALLFGRHWRGLFKQPASIFWLCLVAGWTNLSYVLAVIDGEVMRVMKGSVSGWSHAATGRVQRPRAWSPVKDR